MFENKNIKSLTVDNDISFSHWKQLQEILNTNIYFTNPYHSWEKGLVENTNRWIRCFVSKKRDIATVNEKDLDCARKYINDIPRKCLNYKTPSMLECEILKE